MTKLLKAVVTMILLLPVVNACKKDNDLPPRKKLAGDWELTLQTISGGIPTNMVLRSNYTFYCDNTPGDDEAEMEGTWFINGSHFTAFAPMENALDFAFEGELDANGIQVQGNYYLKDEVVYVTGDFVMKKQ